MSGKVLSTRYIAFVVTVPAGTAIAVPDHTALPLGEVTLVEIDLRIPGGHAGFTGIRFEYAAVPLVPWNDSTAWIMGDDERLTFEVGFDVSAAVDAVAYNTDYFDHFFIVRCKVEDLYADSVTGSTAIVPIV